MVIVLLTAALAATLPQAPAPAETRIAQSAPAPRASVGAVILPYAIDSDPPAPQDLDGLVESEATDRATPDPFGRRTPARQASDEALDQAFEEAADMARFGHPN